MDSNTPFVPDPGSGMMWRPGAAKDRMTPADARLWHYVKKDYLLGMLLTSSVFFRRLSSLLPSDPHEGSSTRTIPRLMDEVRKEKGIDAAAASDFEELVWHDVLKSVLVHCWCHHDVEKVQMWERHGRPEVAIVSTFGQVGTSFLSNAQVGHVDYIDHDSEPSYSLNPLDRAFQKQRGYEDENEVRAVIVDPRRVGDCGISKTYVEPGKEDGYFVHADLRQLIGRIVISPFTPHIRDEVTQAVAGSGLPIPVDASEMSQKPRY